MVFSSPSFVFVFLPLVFLLHKLIRNIKVKNALLIAASLIFYSVGSLVHLPLLLGVAVVNYVCAALIVRGKGKKLFLTLAVVLSLGTLAVFKYLDFFLGSISGLFGLELAPVGLALPIGISFFTFQGLSYTIDVYRKPEVHARSFFEMLLYLSFFPQLIAGPIVQYHDVAEQLHSRKATAEDMALGCRRFILGLSKKLLIADLLGTAVDLIYANSAMTNAGLAWLAAIAYALQIYFDFSGYSDMAIGMGRMFGFHFLENFDLPYISGSVREFWRRWHISLSSWFRDYLYIPLGGNRKGTARTCVNLLIVFFLTGLWHGASWTFVLWGLWHGLWSVLERITPLKKLSGTVWGHIGALLVVVLGFVLFRAESFPQAWEILRGLVTFRSSPETLALLRQAVTWKVILAGAAGIVLASGVQRRVYAGLEGKTPALVLSLAGALVLLVLCVLRLAAASFNPFIYFQF